MGFCYICSPLTCLVDPVDLCYLKDGHILLMNSYFLKLIAIVLRVFVAYSNLKEYDSYPFSHGWFF